MSKEVMLRRNKEISTVNGPMREIMWDSCKSCNVDNCPISESCPYAEQSDKCHVMRIYLDEVFNAALSICGEEINHKEMVRIGVHLMPLYSTLCWLKLHYKALRDPFYTTEKGDVRVHPILAEIRKTVSMIDQIWGKVGLKNSISGAGKSSTIDQWLNGDSGYYEEMAGGEG